jgi:hypothetical protein
MKIFLIVLGVLIGLILIVVLLAVILTPWMDKWHTTPEERAMSLPGDDLLANPARVADHAITVQASVDKIYPWILQIGADKSGMYSYTWLENLVGCTMAKVEEIRPEWQQLKEGDEMKMCAGDFAPPPYIVARVLPDEAVIFGHKTEDKWEETWQFVLIPQSDGTTRLITRTRTNMIGGVWEVVRPISFIMERKMLLTIRDLAETH